jgi:predicted DNA-binding antitoxin AbrB/MazE fold protein
VRSRIKTIFERLDYIREIQRFFIYCFLLLAEIDLITLILYNQDEAQDMRKTIKARGIYKNGLIKPLSALKLPNNIYVTIFLEDREIPSNFDDVVKVAEKTFGSIPDLPDGLHYIKKLRKESESKVGELLHE